MYCMRHLSVYNFIVYITDTNKAYMCIWDETVAFRGNKIMYCLLKILNFGDIGKNKNGVTTAQVRTRIVLR